MSSVYLSDFVRAGKRTEVINNLVAAMGRHRDEFDAVAFRGLSGAIVAPTVAHLLGKDVIAVAKDTQRHGGCLCEGPLDKPYVIVDDFIASGNTIRAIRGAMETEAASYGKEVGNLVGIGLYACDYGRMLGRVVETFGAWVVGGDGKICYPLDYHDRIEVKSTVGSISNP